MVRRAFAILALASCAAITLSLLYQPSEAVSPENVRVAILIAGTLRRFSLNADTKLVAPLTRANFKVDVFLSLFDGASQGWKKASDNFQPDPQLEGLNRSGIQSLLERRFSMPGSRVAGIKLFDQYNTEPQDVTFVDTKHWWEVKLGPQKVRGPIARSNFILLWKELEGLWNLSLSEENLHGQYAYVMILRDDAFWLQDFNLTRLLDASGVHTKASGSGDNGRLYCMLCERSLGIRDWKSLGRVVNEEQPGINDYVFLLDRQAAATFGQCYSRIAQPALFGSAWLANFEKHMVNDGKRERLIDRSELFYLFLAKFAEIDVIQVPASLMPMQRVARLDGQMCLHKYCDSHLANISWLQPEKDMNLCTEAGHVWQKWIAEKLELKHFG
eukprot:Skav228533  [mRNA]  locus=scaffold1887:67132:68289:+ [translate_table: standard]